MLRRYLLTAAIVATAGAVGMTGIDAPTQAASIPAAPSPAGKLALEEASGFQTIATQREKRKKKWNKKRKWNYSRSKHGPRYRYKRGPYVHYYGGYYYSRPWWTIFPGIVIQIN